MATNPKMLEEWAVAPKAPSPPYLQSNSYLREALPTTPSRSFREPAKEVSEFMGVRFTWERAEGAKFPEPIADVFARLEGLASLETNWDSYGGEALKPAVVAPVIELIFKSHRRCSLPTIHPLSRGGVSLTWKRPDCEFEVQIAGDGTLDALFENIITGEKIEVPRNSRVADVLPLLTKYLG